MQSVLNLPSDPDVLLVDWFDSAATKSQSCEAVVADIHLDLDPLVHVDLDLDLMETLMLLCDSGLLPP